MNQKDNISNFIEFKKSREERNNTHVIHVDFKFHRMSEISHCSEVAQHSWDELPEI